MMKTKKPAGQSKPLNAPDAKKIMKEIFPDAVPTPAKAIEKPRGRLLNDSDDRRDLFQPTRAGLRALARELEGEDDFLMQKNLNHERYLMTRLDQFKKLILAMVRVILNE
jgi:hypothetical protein